MLPPGTTIGWVASQGEYHADSLMHINTIKKNCILEKLLVSYQCSQERKDAKPMIIIRKHMR